MDAFFSVLEIVGIVSFAVSGAMIAIDNETDLFGVLFLALTTAFGGGMTRDIFIGNIPPFFFSSYTGIIISVLTALFVFIAARLFGNFYVHHEKAVYAVNNFIDALGLGVFAVMGAEIAMRSENAAVSHPLCVAFCGMISAVGGSLIRDIILRNIPFILCKRIYAVAALSGAVLYMILNYCGVDYSVAAGVSVIMTFSLRIMATLLKWNLPKAIHFHRENKL